MSLFQFGLRTISMRLPGSRPVTLPVLASFLTMYGPVKATYWSYWDGDSLSNFSAYSFGTGTVIGMTRACATDSATGRVSLRTIVWSSGVSMPAIGWTPFVGLVGAPSMSAK